MKITRDFIIQNKSVTGGWNNAQLSALGLEWPPKRGWFDRIIAGDFTQHQIDEFVRLGQHRPSKKERKALRAIAKAQENDGKTLPWAPKREKVPYRSTFVAKQKAATSADFLKSYEWRRLRMVAIQRYGPRCMCCGADASQTRIHVDHIKPRKLFPQLALDIDNLQILCEACNHGKGNWDTTDWRPVESTDEDDRQRAHLRDLG